MEIEAIIIGIRYNNYIFIEVVLSTKARRFKVYLLEGPFFILEIIVLIGERRL